MVRKQPEAGAGSRRKEWVYEKAEFGEDIPNQWSLKLKKADGILPAETGMKDVLKTETVDLKQCLLLKEDGEASVLFDLSHFFQYSIIVLNESDSRISVSLLPSPDRIHFLESMPPSYVSSGQMECIGTFPYIKYMKVVLRGRPNSPVIVFLQGIKF